ncbi:uncharacterized protein SPPG_09243 [Spizellomyces punctatus DAOM BR117]|uniref:RING-type E3 ubiquitin transferase n=1 Tax=Spizellomyces punctatus (strain DAOM BR117) TaxID=645134 RepID=A0A0L0HF45_SPIPD|nr:uncharacterized protein SPPG_09243 [Spizellomyces punctatus DAOM BR117]KNC99656.1 hypothetical protein SPPG_09243 [Spizellomyces punctatus DAOM BR117]|eukprot:XP_016607696.1 hypothetical protein SPPG_09243 [Spizellomyces punctatus DAOM BR117]
MAGDEEEVEICRVCRCPSTPDQPLYYPCKCSGSMKYVHQDCLEEWLQHSRKRQCEICNHAFAFTPIYSDRAPERISVWFFLSIVSRRIVSLARLYLRVFFAAFVWLIWVPYFTVWVWRIYFNPRFLFNSVGAGSTMVWQAVAIYKTIWAPVNTISPGNETRTDLIDVVDGVAHPSNLNAADYRKILNTFFTDVFEGQIIASVAVVICLAFLCLKEYVVMNTPVDPQGNPVNVPDEAAAMAEAPPLVDRPVQPIFVRRDRLPLNDVHPREQMDQAEGAPFIEPNPVERRDEGQQDEGEAKPANMIAGYDLGEPSNAQHRKTGLQQNGEDVDGRPHTKTDYDAFSHGKAARILGNDQESSLTTRAPRGNVGERLEYGAVRSLEDEQNEYAGPNNRLINIGTSSDNHWSALRDDRLSSSEVTGGEINGSVADFEGTSDLGSTNKLSTNSLSDGARTPFPGLNDSDLIERERKLISAAIYDEKQYRERHSAGSETGKGKNTATSANELEGGRSDALTLAQSASHDAQPSSGDASSSFHVEASEGNGKASSIHMDAEHNFGWDTGLPENRVFQGQSGSAHLPRSLSAVRLQHAETDLETYRRRRSSMSDLGPPAGQVPNGFRPENTPALGMAPVPVMPPIQRPPVEQPQLPPPPAQAPAPPAPVVDPNPNADNNDVNAFLELVGVQGPLENLAQNVTMVLLVIIVALGIGVLWPYLTGRFMVWLIKDIYAPSLEWIVGSLQKVTDPVLDPVVDVTVWCIRLLGIRAGRGGKWREGLGTVKGNLTSYNVTDVLPKNLTEGVNEVGTGIRAGVAPVNDVKVPVHANVLELMEQVADLEAQVEELGDGFIRNEATVKDAADVSPEGSASNGSADLPEGSPEAAREKDAMENLKKRAADRKTTGGDGRKGKRVAGVPDKVLFTAVGYTTHGFFIMDYARRTGLLQHPYAQTVKRIMMKWVLYVIMAAKFSFFLTIELGIFPFFCGVLIDICTLPVFGPSATIASRWAFYNAHPWTSEFLHWLAGTTFMFQFALYVSTVREIVRPGVMWFIRDPNDPQFHPMNDILERPVLTQLRKLAVGTIMYAGMVLGGVGGFVSLVWSIDRLFGIKEGPGKIWPLQWDLSIPVSEFPIDLLIFHFVVPWTVAWIRPKRILRWLVDQWFRWTARRLRLTSFLFGGAHKDEESDDEVEVEVNDATEEIVYHDEAAPSASADSPSLEGNGTVEQPAAPAHSQEQPLPTSAGSSSSDRADDADDEWEDEEVIVLNGPGPRTPPSTTTGIKRKRWRPRREYRYMRVPNHDHVEVIAGQKMLIPLKFGEGLMGREGETEEEVRVNWTKVYVPDRFKIRIAVLLLFQWVCGVVLMTTVIVGPLYLGRIISIEIFQCLPELDVFAPANPTTSDVLPRRAIRPDLPPFRPLGTGRASVVDGHTAPRTAGGPPTRALVQAVLQDWALGAVYMKIAWALVMVGPDTEVKRVLTELVRGGVRRLRVGPIWQKVLFPLVAICIGLAAGPWALGILMQMMVKDGTVSTDALRWVFPGALLSSLLGGILWVLVGFVKRWMEQVKEEEFLVGRKLHNLEDTGEGGNEQAVAGEEVVG